MYTSLGMPLQAPIVGNPQAPPPSRRQIAIAQWLGNLLEQTGWTQNELKRRSGVGVSTINRAINMQGGALKETTVAKLARAAKMPMPRLPTEDYEVAFEFAEPEIVQLTAEASVQESPPHPDLSRWRVQTHVLELAGLLPGAVVTIDRRVPPLQDDVVCVQLIDLSRGSAVTVLRRYQPPYVVTATLDRQLEDTPRAVDGRSVDIVGTMVSYTWSRPSG